MTYDEEGNILICDCGNNYNYRKDLAIYKIAEPNPYYAAETGIIAKYLFRYPDQKEFPPSSKKEWNFDAEAIFSLNKNVYIISKSRGDLKAKLYRFKNLKPFEVNIPEIEGEFDFKSMVTDAAVSPDSKHLAVLTYNYIWIFEIKSIENLFKNPHYFKEISLGQCEGVTFLNENEILISNEEGYIFKLTLNDIKIKTY